MPDTSTSPLMRSADTLRLGPFQIGDLGFARHFEHAVARVPVGLQGDVVEMAVRQAADQRCAASRGERLDAPARGGGRAARSAPAVFDLDEAVFDRREAVQ